MTKEEFREQFSDIEEVMSYVYDHDLYDYFEDVYSEDSVDECINNYIDDYRGSWYDLRDYLDRIETGYSYYLDTYDGWAPLTYSDLDDMVDRLIDALGDDFFTEEELEEEPVEELRLEEEEPEDDMFCDSDFDPIGLFAINSGVLPEIA